MLEHQLRSAEARPTETELQQIAKRAYDELLADLLTGQRSQPWAAEEQRTANQAMIQRLMDNGGHASVSERDIDQRLAEGWSEDRTANMAQVVRLREKERSSRSDAPVSSG